MRTNGHDLYERCAVYFLYGDHDILLYVGISKHPDFRLIQHYQAQPWAFLIRQRYVTWFDTRLEALDAERVAIEKDAPLFNIALADEAWQQRWHSALRWMWRDGWALTPWRLPALAHVIAAEPRFWDLIVDLHRYLDSASDWCADCLWEDRYKAKVRALAGYDAENPTAQDSRTYELAVSLVWEALPNGACAVHDLTYIDPFDDLYDDLCEDWDAA